MSDGEEPSGTPWDIDSLKRLLCVLQGTDIDELEVVRGSFRLFLRRDPHTAPSVHVSTESGEKAELGLPVVAPLTGVFYGRPTPEQAPYVMAGDVVDAGQVVALIETMKLFNEVLVEVAGEVVEIDASDGDLVEVGQVLFRVIPRLANMGLPNDADLD